MSILKLFIFFICLPVYILHSQDKDIDSLLSELGKAGNEFKRVDILNKLGNELYKTKPDEASGYLDEALNLAGKIDYRNGLAENYYIRGINFYFNDKFQETIDYLCKSLDIYIKIKERKYIKDIYSILGYIYTFGGEYTKALDAYNNLFNYYQFANDMNGMAKSLTNLGNIYYLHQNKFFDALDMYLRASKCAEKAGDRQLAANCYVNIGLVNKELRRFDEAKEYSFKALGINLMLADKESIANNYANLGKIYIKEESYDSALYFLNNGYQYASEINNVQLTATILSDKAYIYYFKKDYALSLDLYEQAVKLYKQIDYFMALAYNYSDIAKILIITNSNLPEALHLLDEAFAIAGKSNDYFLLKQIYDSYSDYYELTGDFKKSLEFRKLFINIKDSVLNIENNIKIANLEAKQDIEVFQERDKRQKIMIFATIGGLMLMFFIVLLIMRSLRIKNKANHLLTGKNELISEQNKNIISSINYAQKIQQAILPIESIIREFLPHIFIFYKPRDIVSGDFYWFSVVENTIVLAVVDCTGHGVPGAFMSMIGNDLLNDIVIRNRITEPSKILIELHNGVRYALKQESEEASAQDGMDTAIISVRIEQSGISSNASHIITESNRMTFKIEFAGAKRPLYIIRKGKFEEIKGDRFSIGGRQRLEDVKFTNHFIKHFDSSEASESCDLKLYLATDGFADMHNPGNQKYGSRRFKEFLLRISQYDMDKQREMLELEYDSFRQGEKSRDDITVVGIKTDLICKE